MDFKTSIFTCFQKYATFKGRASRSEFWWWFLFTFLVGLALCLYPDLAWIVSIVLILPNIAVAVRRLHDTNRSGWLFLLGIIPIVGAIILIVWFCEESDSGRNQYGPRPTDY